MGIIVQKFGGSSVADVEKIQFVADKVVQTRRAGHDVVVVVSAMGHTTDDLLALARQINEQPSRRELDMLLSVGERISMALLSMAIQNHGIDAISFTGSQSGIITTAGHSEARIVEVRPYRIQDELEQGRVVIVAGYQGVSYKREVTTLGRGGSDTTAVALAAALGAEACEIYSDVEGVFSSDPRVVDDASLIGSITYEEMQELARLGAKVLNATAVEFARRSQIALYARATRSNSPGTAIHGGGNFHRTDGFDARVHVEETGLGVRAISGMARGLLLSLDGDSAEQVDRLLGLTEELQTPLCQVDASTGAVRLLVNLDNVHELPALVRRLRAELGEGLTVAEGVGLVAAVGEGVGDRPRVARAALSALREAGITPSVVRASGPSVTVLVPTDAVPASMRALHAALVTGVAQVS